jgi:signal transduction histidine kinase
VRVSGDAAKLSQAIRNLADNAVRAAHGTVRFTLAERAGTATVAVEDDGDGVPAAERSRVFERFVRLDASRARGSGGSGLGLSIVREVVRGHGGTVEVFDSALGGARFVISLPVAGVSGPGESE